MFKGSNWWNRPTLMMLAEKHKDSQREARDARVQTCGLFIHRNPFRDTVVKQRINWLEDWICASTSVAQPLRHSISRIMYVYSACWSFRISFMSKHWDSDLPNPLNPKISHDVKAIIPAKPSIYVSEHSLIIHDGAKKLLVLTNPAHAKYSRIL